MKSSDAPACPPRVVRSRSVTVNGKSLGIYTRVEPLTTLSKGHLDVRMAIFTREGAAISVQAGSKTLKSKITRPRITVPIWKQ